MELSTSALAVLFPLGGCLYIALRLGDARTDERAGGRIKTALYTLASLLITISLLGIMFRLGVQSVVWLFFTSIVLFIVFLRSFALNRSLMFHSLTAVDSDAAKIAMAKDFERYGNRYLRRRATKFLRCLQSDSNWAHAMQGAGIASTSTEIFACRMFAQYRSHWEDVTSPLIQPLRIQQEVERLLGRLYMLPWAILGLASVSLFFWLIVPTFLEMFQEFGISIPVSMERVILVYRLLDDNGFMIHLSVVMLFLWMLGCYLSLVWLFPKLAQHLPFSVLSMPYYRGLGLAALAFVLQRESSFSSACIQASRLIPVKMISRRLELAAQLSRNGCEVTHSLRQVGFISKFQAENLQLASVGQSLGWAIEQLAIDGIERLMGRYNILAQYLLIAFTLALALACGFIAVAIIESLSTLILQMS